jgi:transposase
MKKLYPVNLTDEQHAQLDRLLRRGTAPARVLTRTRILVLAHQGLPDPQIAAALLIGLATVARIRRRFVREGLEEALYDRPHTGRPPHLTGEVEAQLVLLACSAPPSGRARWTLQLLADRLIALHVVETISDQAVHTLLKKTNLSPGNTNTGAFPRRMRAS